MATSLKAEIKAGQNLLFAPSIGLKLPTKYKPSPWNLRRNLGRHWFAGFLLRCLQRAIDEAQETLSRKASMGKLREELGVPKEDLRGENV